MTLALQATRSECGAACGYLMSPTQHEWRRAPRVTAASGRNAAANSASANADSAAAAAATATVAGSTVQDDVALADDPASYLAAFTESAMALAADFAAAPVDALLLAAARVRAVALWSELGDPMSPPWSLPPHVIVQADCTDCDRPSAIIVIGRCAPSTRLPSWRCCW